MSSLPLKIQKKIRSFPGNRRCVDCSTKNPQWASISYGTLFCLECSGRHRALGTFFFFFRADQFAPTRSSISGVHISFVRSIQMDSWTDKQIRSLEVGGNENMRSFFQRKGVPSTLTIREKYHTEQATAYRKKIKALVDGAPEPSEDDIPQYVAPKKNTGGNKKSGDYVGMSREKQRSAEAAARERMRNKFKNGMRGVGSNGGTSQQNRFGHRNPDWMETSGAALQQTLGKAFEAASRQTDKLRQRDWSRDRKAVKSEVSKGVSWLSTSVSTLWKSAARAISDDEPVKFYRSDGDRPRSSGFGKGISSDDSSVRKKKSALIQQEQPERRRSRSYSPKKSLSNDWDNDGWDDDDYDDGNDNGVIQKSKKKNGTTTSHSSNQQKRLPTSEYDPFDLEKDFLGEIDAVLNDASDDDTPTGRMAMRKKATTTAEMGFSRPPSLPKATSTTTSSTTSTTTTTTAKAAKPKTLSGDDFFSSFGV